MLRQVLGSMIAVGMAFAAPVSHAKEKPVTLTSDVKLERVIEDDGVKHAELAPAEGVVPGDTLVFSTNYRNASGETVTDFVIVNPIPANLALAGDVPAGAQVSIDGGSTWGSLAMLSITDEGGEERPAALTDVTHLRWTIASVGPAQHGQVGYRAVVR